MEPQPVGRLVALARDRYADEPLLQELQPASAYVPAGQVTQDSIEPAPCCHEEVPAGQRVQSEARKSDQVPARQVAAAQKARR